MNDSLTDRLARNVGELSFSLPPAVDQKLLDFIALLDKWNHAYNLTAVRQPAQMIARHLMDSLVVVPYLHGQRILDVGSGAGLPGIPLALPDPTRAKNHPVTR